MQKFLILLKLILPITGSLMAQDVGDAFQFTGLVYDLNFNPLPFTNVIAEGSMQGDMTDSLGIFIINVRDHDRLHFYNIAFEDTIIAIDAAQESFFVRLKPKIYELQEAKIFDWGNSYEDFKADVLEKSKIPALGERVGLPRQTPGIIPLEMNEKILKSSRFIFSSPLTYLYFNYSKRERSARKAFELEQNKERIEEFKALISPDNLQTLTGLKEKELKAFILYLNAQLTCDYRCTDIEILNEVFTIWENYKLLSQ